MQLRTTSPCTCIAHRCRREGKVLHPRHKAVRVLLEIFNESITLYLFSFERHKFTPKIVARNPDQEFLPARTSTGENNAQNWLGNQLNNLYTSLYQSNCDNHRPGQANNLHIIKKWEEGQFRKPSRQEFYSAAFGVFNKFLECNEATPRRTLEQKALQTFKTRKMAVI